MALQFIFERITYIGFVDFLAPSFSKIKTLNLNIHFLKKNYINVNHSAEKA